MTKELTASTADESVEASPICRSLATNTNFNDAKSETTQTSIVWANMCKAKPTFIDRSAQTDLSNPRENWAQTYNQDLGVDSSISQISVKADGKP